MHVTHTIAYSSLNTKYAVCLITYDSYRTFNIVRVNTYTYKCTDTVGWVAGRTPGPLKSLCHITKGSVLEQMEAEAEWEAADPGSTGYER